MICYTTTDWMQKQIWNLTLQRFEKKYSKATPIIYFHFENTVIFHKMCYSCSYILDFLEQLKWINK
jgi:hypothetical protein